MNEATQGSERILVVALNDREAGIARDELDKAGFGAFVCGDFDTLCREIEAGAGAALLVEEHLLDPGRFAKLAATLAEQPPWSDFPLLVVAARKRAERQTGEPLAELGNVTLLDPPLRIRSLARAATAALRGRRRQYAAQRAIVERDRFLAMLGHELRNPLSAIALATELAEHDASASFPQLPVVRRQVQHLTRLVDDLLDVARVTTGRIELARRPTALEELLGEVLSTMRPRFEAAGIDLRVRGAEPVIVDVDPVRIEQVISNLLTNALKYSSRGGEVRVELWRDGDHACLSVTDTGAGIGAAILPRIFDPFVQGESTLDRAQGGMGVGLALVRTLVELHGGQVRAKSEGRGCGSTFSLTLPVQRDGRADAQAEACEAVQCPAAPRTILLVEDNDDARELLSVALHRAGHRVIEASDGEEALDRLGEAPVDAAIVDIGLPRIDGFEVARRARRQFGSALHLIALSGYGQPQDRQHALEAGFDVHLTKPTDLGRLCALLAGGMSASA